MKKKIMSLVVGCILAQSVSLNGVISFAETKNTLPVLDFADSYSEGLSLVGIWEGYWKYGYLDKSFKIKIPFQYNFAKSFKEGIALVGVGKDADTRKYGYIKKDGKLLHPMTLSYAEEFNLGYGIFGVKSAAGIKKGVLNSSGKVMIKAEYDDVSVTPYHLKKGIITLRKGDYYGYYNVFTNKLVEPKYSSIIVLDDFMRVSLKVGNNEKMGVVLFSGVTIEPKYDWIHSNSNGIKDVICMVEVNGKFGLLKNDGKYFLDPKYDKIMTYQDTMTQVTLGDQLGYLNADGSWLTKIEFDEGSAFHRGVAHVKKNGKWGLLNIDGSYRVEPKYDQVFFLRNEIQVIDQGVKKLLTKEGQYRFDPSMEYMSPFYSVDGAVKVKKNGKEIILSSDGKPLYQVDFDTISEFDVIEKGYAYIMLNDKVGYLNRAGAYFIKPIYDGAFKDVYTDDFHIKLNEKWGIVFPNGDTIEPAFEGPLTFEGAFGVARINDKEAYINRQGVLLSNLTFDQIHPFSEDRGRVYVGGKTRYVDEKGQLIPGEYAFGSDFKNGYALVYNDGKYTFINKNGDLAFTKSYNGGKFIWAKEFSNGYAAFMDNSGIWGYLDTAGRIRIEPKFSSAFGFFEKDNNGKQVSPVIESGKIGFIDVKGSYVVQPKYQYATTADWHPDFSVVWKEGQIGTINRSGLITNGMQVIKSAPFYKIQTGSELTLFKVIDAVTGKELYGYLKSDGSWLVKPEFDFALKFENGKGTVFKNGKQGSISTGGVVTWQ